MKTINVVAAIIIKDQKIFATQRGYGEFEHALEREIREELDAKIRVGELFDTIEYDYPNFHLSMKCFLCSLISDQLTLREHEAAKWLTKENLSSVEWLPADITIIDKLKSLNF